MPIHKKTLNGMSFSHQNVFHLLNKIPDITALLANGNKTTHVLGLSETRSYENSPAPDNLFYIQDYGIPYRRNINHSFHTGLAVYVHKSVSHAIERRPDLESKYIESLWLEIKQNHKAPRLVAYIYRKRKPCI